MTSSPSCPEFELLLCCARAHPDPANTLRISSLLSPKIDWQVLLEQAGRHKLLALLYRNLKMCCAEKVPAEIMEQLHSSAVNITARNLQQTGALLSILALFEQHGIEAVPFKGPILAQAVYGNINLRQFSDLDLLVASEDAIAARDLLLSAGYRTSIDLQTKQERAYLETENFFSLLNEKEQVTIDLHWELTGRYSLKPLYLNELKKRLITISLAGKEQLGLSHEDTLLYLCIHSTSHCWQSLEWLSCIAELIQSSTGLKWDFILARATEIHCRRMLLLGMFLCQQLMDVTLPTQIISLIQADKKLRGLGHQVMTSLAEDTLPTHKTLSWRFSLLHISIRDSLLDSLRYSIRLLFLPTIKEWQRWPLPGSLSFLLYVLRPLRLAWEFLKARHRRLTPDEAR